MHVKDSGCVVCVCVLVASVAPVPFAATKGGQFDRSCKQSADHCSNTCAPCLQHTYWKRLGGMGGDEVNSDGRGQGGLSFGAKTDGKLV